MFINTAIKRHKKGKHLSKCANNSLHIRQMDLEKKRMETFWGAKKWNHLLKGRCSDKIRILGTLAGLSSRQMKVLWLSYCQPEKLQTWQIAEKLSISERTVKNEKRTALMLIQSLCEEYKVDRVSGDLFFKLGEEAGLPRYVLDWKP